MCQCSMTTGCECDLKYTPQERLQRLCGELNCRIGWQFPNMPTLKYAVLWYRDDCFHLPGSPYHLSLWFVRYDLKVSYLLFDWWSTQEWKCPQADRLIVAIGNALKTPSVPEGV